jgi:hypothetical protein
MEEIEEIEQMIDQNICTPETMAWNLLMGIDIPDFYGAMQFSVIGNEKHSNDQYDHMAQQFEILITMYMEMVFGLLKINNMCESIDKGSEKVEEFTPDLSQFTLEQMTEIFRDKFKKIRYYLTIIEYKDDQSYRDIGYNSDYYCRVILKHTVEGKKYFDQNKHRLDEKLNYTFAIRPDKIFGQKKLNDFHAVCTLPQMKIAISFSPINVIIENKQIL